jgi:hypothetical protein
LIPNFVPVFYGVLKTEFMSHQSRLAGLVAILFIIFTRRKVKVMKEFKRVLRRVLWQEDNYRMVRYLCIYGHGDGSWEAPYWSEPTMYWEIQECTDHWPREESGALPRLDGECDWQTVWDVSRIKGWYRDDYLYAESALRARITRRNSKLGKEWLQRHKRLLASPFWQIKCDSIDGEGTLCPIAFSKPGRCYITSWFIYGHSGSPGGRQWPGICDMPKDQTNIPLAYDKFGCSLKYYRDILLEKRGFTP